MSGITVETAIRVSHKLTRVYHELAEIRVLLSDSQSPGYEKQRRLHDVTHALEGIASSLDLVRQDLLQLFCANTLEIGR